MQNHQKFPYKHLQRYFDQISHEFDSHDFLFRDINQKQISRMKLFQINPQTILDCGCGTGVGTQLLLEQFKKSTVYSLDMARNMLSVVQKKKKWRQNNVSVQAQAHKLPFKTNSFDLVYANLMLNFCEDFSLVFQEWQRILKPNGLLMFTALGPDTLKEFKSALKQIQPQQPSPEFTDMHDIGDLLVKHHLTDPVLDIENLKIEYKNPEKCLADLRLLGGKNLHPDRLKHLMGKNFRQSLIQFFETSKNSAGQFSISLEIIFAHAFASSVSSQTTKDNVVSIPVGSLKIQKK